MRTTPVILTLILLLVAGPVAASTSMLFGTIVAVDHEKKTCNIRTDFFNYTGRGEGSIYCWRYDPARSPKLFILDGRPSTAEQALVVGRAVTLWDGAILIASSDCTGPDADRQGKDPRNGIYEIDLGSRALNLVDVRGKEKSCDLRLVLDVINGVIAHGVAISAGLSKLPYHEADCSDLAVGDGKVTGTVKVAVIHPAKPGTEPVAVSYTLDAGLAAGKLAGTCAGKDIGGKLTGSLLPRLAPPDPGRVWLRVAAPCFAKGHVFAVFDVAGGAAQAGGSTFWHKGTVNGTIGENALRVDVANRRVTGHLVATLTKHGEGEYRIGLDAPIVGGRWILGPVTVEHGGEIIRGRVRGGLVGPTAPVQGATPELVKQYKELCSKHKEE